MKRNSSIMLSSAGICCCHGWKQYSRSYLFFFLVTIFVKFGVLVTQGKTGAHSVLYKYGATKNLPNKILDENLPCETQADRQMRFNSGDRSERNIRICQGDVEFSTKSGIDNSGDSICPVVDNNSLILTMYSITPAYLQDPTTVFSWILISVLRDLMPQYKILSISDRLNNTSSNATDSKERDDRKDSSAILSFYNITASEMNRTKIIKKWRFDLKFAVCGGTNPNSILKNITQGDPVSDSNYIDSILQEMINALNTKEGLPSLNAPAFVAASKGNLNLSFAEDVVSESPQTSQNNTNAILLESYIADGKFFGGTDVSPWGLRQTAGLIVLVATTCITAMLLFMSSNYEIWRIHQVLWGNLGTEEGVDALLEALPQVKEGRIKVYNKRNWGYSDESDSDDKQPIFIGGYQYWRNIKYDSKPNESSTLVIDSQYTPTPPAIEAESLLQDLQPTTNVYDTSHTPNLLQ